jgi:4-amino-4-deoxy-L-arabinose transferase-like glycosyltransferase
VTVTELPVEPPAVTCEAFEARRGPLARWWRGRVDDPPWVRPWLLVLLAGTAFVYLVDLSHSGWANAFYSGAVQAGSRSWEAFFFGSSDAANFITVDKPPAALWVMDISARLFGLSPWSVLAPQALEGVASVGLVYLTVRRSFSARTALSAGLILALTPVAALMFRFNNPDALLVLLVVGATYATLRAVESGRTSWLLLAGGLVGTGFLVKLVAAFIVLPVLAGVYLLAGPPKLGRRIVQLLAAGAVLAVSASWWIVAVSLVPPGSRPYIGGSQDNSLPNVIIGYNGLGRLSGKEIGNHGWVSSSSGGAGLAGPLRLLDPEFRTPIGWFLPAAVVALAAGLWLTRRAARTDRVRAAFLAWGGSLVLTGAVFSAGQGIIHTYYAVALAPAVAVLVACGTEMLWARRDRVAWRRVLAVTAASTIVWSLWIVTTVEPWRSPRLLFVDAVLAFPALLLACRLSSRRARRLAASLTVLLCLAGPATQTVGTVAAEHHSAVPMSGFLRISPHAWARIHLVPAAGTFSIGSEPTPAMVGLLRGNGDRYTWVAATVGSERAAGYQLASGRPVMPVGGFNGTDPAPTLSGFQRDVATGRVHWFIGVGSAKKPPGGRYAKEIAGWVERRFPVTVIDTVRFYDLSAHPR